MGKAKIVSGGDGGQYNIELVRDIAKITSAITKISARLDLLVPAISAALAAKNASETALLAKSADLDAAVVRLRAGEIAAGDVNAVQKEYLSALKDFQGKIDAHRLLLQEQESKTKQKAQLQAAAATDARSGVWCADLTEDLPPGEEVGTIEINGEQTQIIIYPGGDWDNLPSALLQPVLASSPAGAFYNQAVLPGWQRWKPTYRIGVIASISGNYCGINLVSSLSSEQQLNINPSSAMLSNVPIEYMSGLDGSVFAVGDRVVVEFADFDWTKPKVIGFEKNPRGANLSNNKYYIFYQSGGILKIANCRYSGGITVVNTKTSMEVSISNANSTPITFHCKRFRHNVPANGVTTARDLYFIATSLYINPNPYAGWTNFAAANPTFPLVANNANTEIAMTEQARADLNAVNAAVNNAHIYASDPAGNEYWHIMDSGETGDCEDFALTKAKMLLDMGYPASALHIECGRIEGSATPNVGHAWLVVQTTAGDYALDLSSDAIISNKLLRHSSAGEFYCRRRQIGSNWAFIDSFGWLQNAANSLNGSWFWYIFDPLLNIFYYIKAYPYPPINNMSSINFSPDNNSIYIYNVTDSQIDNFLTLNLLENELNKSFSTVIPNNNYDSYVDRDGNLVNPGNFGSEDLIKSGSVEILSPDGYYDYYGYGSPYDTGMVVNEPPTTITIGNASNPFWETFVPGSSESMYHTPWGEEISSVDDDGFRFPWQWLHIEGDYNFQGFFFYPGEDARLIGTAAARSGYVDARIYKNNVDCLSSIMSAVGSTEENIFGFAYVPFSDRLNR